MGSGTVHQHLRPRDVACFLRERVPHNFVGWTDEAMEDYALFHAEQRTLVAAPYNNRIFGVLIAWGQDEDHQVQFEWQPHNSTGSYWWWDQYVADDPDAAMGLGATYFELHPRSVMVPGLGIRNGRLRRYRPGAMLKLYEIGERFYGNKR